MLRTDLVYGEREELKTTYTLAFSVKQGSLHSSMNITEADWFVWLVCKLAATSKLARYTMDYSGGETCEASQNYTQN